MVTSIQISDEMWQTLNSMKSRGETFEDIIKGLIENQKEVKNRK